VLGPIGHSRAWIGGIYDLGVTGLPASPGALFLITGIGLVQWNSQPLPLNLLPFGMPQCFLWQTPDDVQLRLYGGGSASASLVVPFNTAIVGMPFSQQALVIDPLAGNALGATITNASRGMIGWR
jgi:hypothetical protein